MRRLAIGRIIGILIAIASIAASISCARDSADLKIEYEEALIAHPIEATIDLSKPGETKLPFQQTFSRSHGESICIQITPSIAEDQEPKQLLKELTGKIIIKDGAGKEIETVKIDSTTMNAWGRGEDVILTDIAPFTKGEYKYPVVSFSYL